MIRFDTEEQKRFILELLHAENVLIPIRNAENAAAIIKAVREAEVSRADTCNTQDTPSEG